MSNAFTALLGIKVRTSYAGCMHTSRSREVRACNSHLPYLQEPVGSGHVEVSALPGDSTLASGLAKKTGAGLLAYLSHAPGIPSSHEVNE